MSQVQAPGSGARVEGNGREGPTSASVPGEGRAPLVAVGASAGGLQALSAFLRFAPVEAGVCYLVLQHMAPGHQSLLPDLLARTTRLPVRLLRDGDEPQADQVLIAPPGHHVVLRGGAFRLQAEGPPIGPRPCITQFLESAVDDGLAARCIGVVLSGTGGDGSAGLQALRAAGGVALVQEPSTAQYEGMPRTALAAGEVDGVLAPEDMGAMLARLVDRDGLVPRAPATERSPTKGWPEKGDLKPLLRRLHDRVKVDFSGYKEPTIWRRIGRRMAAVGSAGLADYLEHVDHHPEELDALGRDMLISVTAFMRDPTAMAQLRDQLFAIVDRAAGGVRAWVAGCATGEEAWTLAMILHDAAQAAQARHENPSPPALQIMATDIDERALEQARRGVYPALAVAELPPDMVTRHFAPHPEGYEIRQHLRDVVLFARHNLLSDPPFLRLDVVTCRNVLIYMQPGWQDRVFAAFHYGMKPGALLMLGQSESTQGQGNRFDEIDRDARLYRRNGQRARPPLPVRPMPTRSAPAAPATPALHAVLDGALARRYGPAAVLIDLDGMVLQFSGDLGGLLNFPPGRARLDLRTLLREDLRAELTHLLQRLRAGWREPVAAASEVPFRSLPRRLEIDGEAVMLTMTAERIEHEPAPLAMICFERRGVEAGTRSAADALAPSDSLAAEQLLSTREQLDSALQQLESFEQEAQSLTEELQSTNEQLQTSNEELESANEELQAANEELSVVNDELQGKTQQQARIAAELQDVQDGLDFALLVFDGELLLRRVNRAAAQALELDGSAVGRPLTAIPWPPGLPSVNDAAATLMQRSGGLDLEGTDDLGRRWMVHLATRTSVDGETAGLLVMMRDVSQRWSSERAAREARRRLAELMRHSALLAAVLDIGGRVEMCNSAFETALGVAPEAAIGQPVQRLLADDVGAEFRGYQMMAARDGRPVTASLVLRAGEAAAGTARHLLCTWFPLLDDDRIVTGVGFQALDVSDRQEAEATKARMTALIDSSEDAVIAKTPEGIVTDWNPGAERLYGWRADEIIGRHVDLLVLPERQAEQRALMAAATTQRVKHRLNTVRRHKDGHEIHVAMTLSPIIDPQGRVIGISELAQNDSERLAAAQALQAAEQYWRDLANALPQLVWTCDAAGSCNFLSEQWLRYTGKPEAEQLGGGWLAQVHDEDRAAVAAAWTRSVRERQSYRAEFRLLRHDGIYQWFYNRADAVIDADGSVSRWIGSSTEIESLKLAEAEVRRLNATLALKLDAQAEKLRQTARDLQGVLDNVDAWIAYWDTDVRCRFGNRGFMQRFGIEPGSLVGMHMREVVGEAVYAQRKPYVEGALRGEPQQFVTDRALPDGSGIVTRQAQYRPDIDERGRVRGFYVTVIDVSKLRTAQKRAEALSAFSNALIENSPLGIGVYRADGLCVRANPALCTTAGAKEAELLRQNFRTLPSWQGTGLLEAADRVLAGGGVEHLDVQARTSFDRSVYLACALARVELDGTPQLLLLTRDVSEQQRALMALRASDTRANGIFQASPVAMLVVDEDGRVESANAAADDLFGYGDGGLRGVGVDQLMDEALRARHAQLRAGFMQAPRPREMGAGLDLQARRVDGTMFPVDISIAPLALADRRVIIATIEDLTDQKRQEAELIAARDAAEQAAHAKSSFLANMSHEIRTPMNAIIGLSRLALEDGLPAASRGYVDKVHQSAHALLGILNDVLDYSKIEAGQLRFERLSVDLEDLLQRVADLFMVRVEQKGLVFAIDLPPDVPRRIMGDPLRLSQVINNLVGNAVKFTDQGSVTLTVTWLKGEAHGCPEDATAQDCIERSLPCVLRFAVKDTGIGIDAAAQAALFEPFKQGDDSITRRFGGSGLGLTISKRLVELMGGEMGVRSTPGQGSEFWFSAKLYCAPEVPERAHVGDVAGMRVLVVDDSPLMTRILTRQLLEWDVQVQAVADGESALTAVEQAWRDGRPYHVVLLDWQMPGLDGVATMRRLRQAGVGGDLGAPVVVMVTAFSRDQLLQAAGEQPPEAVITKPVLASPLLDALLRSVPDRRPAYLDARGPGSGPGAGTLAPLEERAASIHGRRVLLAEDNELNQIVAEGLLERLGLVVDIAANGREAVEAVSGHPRGHYAAVLMDMHMPVVDGLEATRQLERLAQAHGGALPVIAMTAAALPDDRARCFEAGMVDHVTKPIVPEQLLSALLRWIDVSTPLPDDAGGANGEPGDRGSAAAPPARVKLEGFDLDTLRARLRGDVAMVWKVLEIFVRVVAGSVSRLRERLEAQAPVDEIRGLAHDLKGSSANVGAVRLAAAASAVDDVLREGRVPAAALLDELDASLQECLISARAALAARERGASPMLW